jgi:integrase/recombinase XerD
LPDTLAIAEIDSLMAIDLSSNEGERNRAMLETLYGCGLRVSVVGLKNQICFEGLLKSQERE